MRRRALRSGEWVVAAQMGELLAQLIPTAIVGALSPLPVLVAIALLMSERGLAKAAAFTAALTGTFLVMGLVVLAVADTDGADSDGGRAVAGAVIAVVGGFLVVMALKQLLGAPDPDATPPRFMERLDQMPPGRAAVLGLVTALVNVKQLGIFVAGVSQIVTAGVTGTQAWIALLVFVLLLQAGVIVPIVGVAVAREPATRWLRSFQGWLTRHKRTISIVLGLVVGAAFVVAGVRMITG
jgi:threonine/homoserine/homoserine lactone efflux protein